MENPIPTQKEALRIVQEADNNYTPLKLFHQIGCPKTLKLLKKLRVRHARFLVNHARAVLLIGPCVLFEHLSRYRIYDPRDPEAEEFYSFLKQLVRAWDKKNAA